MRLIMVAALALMPLLAKDSEPTQRLEEAAAVFSEVMATPDRSIPQDLLANAHCIVIVPDLKTAAFVFGGKYGKIWGKGTCPVETKAARVGPRQARSASRAGALASRLAALRRT